MATKNTRTRKYSRPSAKALGLNRRLPNGNILVAAFGAKDKAAKAIVTVVCQKGTNVMFLNLRGKAKGSKGFSAPVARLARPKGMTITRLAWTASRTGHVYLRKAA